MTDYPTYSPNTRVTLDRIRSWRTFRGMHPNMQERVAALIEASGGKIGLGQGLRDPTQQLQLFLSRHVPDPGGRYSFDGKRWSRLPNVAAAAPPGLSMHEIGLAADITGDMSWLGQNAGRFDLQTFADVNREPWHVQPAELPRGRSAYQRNPVWGMPPWDDSEESSISPSSQPSTKTERAPLKLTPALRARPGDSGPAVDIMIEALIARGRLADEPATRDGSYDPDDQRAVEAFQEDEGLFVDGIVGPQTWGALLTVVRPGDEGPQARVLQVTLIHRGLVQDTPGNRDGTYGPLTQEVVAQFQGAAGLGVDKEVGPATWTALIGEKRRVQVTTRGGPPAAEVDDEYDPDDLDILEVLAGRPGE